MSWFNIKDGQRHPAFNWERQSNLSNLLFVSEAKNWRSIIKLIAPVRLTSPWDNKNILHGFSKHLEIIITRNLWFMRPAGGQYSSQDLARGEDVLSLIYALRGISEADAALMLLDFFTNFDFTGPRYATVRDLLQDHIDAERAARRLKP